MEDASRHQQVLYTLRLYIESRYRSQVLDESVRRPFSPKMSADRRRIDKAALCLDDGHCFESRRGVYEAIVGHKSKPVPGRKGFEGIVGCGNKTVPIYVFAREEQDAKLQAPMAERRRDIFEALDSHVYRTWFRPFETNIDCEQQFAKVIVPQFEPRSQAGYGTGQFGRPSWINLARDYVGAALTLSKGLCDSFDQAQAVLQDQVYQFRCFKIRPLFRALAIVLLEDDYDDCCKNNRNSIGKMRVLLVSTGATEGLSVPIKLPNVSVLSPDGGGPDPDESPEHATKPGVKIDIEITNLEMAVRFVMKMEEREKNVTGQLDLNTGVALKRWIMPCDHPTCHSFLSSLPREFAWDIGWKGKDITGPSSSWVDYSKYQYPEKLYHLSISAILGFPVTDKGRYHIWQCNMSQKRRIVSWWVWHSKLSAEERNMTSGQRSGMWIFRFCSAEPCGSPELAYITDTSRPILLATGRQARQRTPTNPLQDPTGSCIPQ